MLKINVGEATDYEEVIITENTTIKQLVADYNLSVSGILTWNGQRINITTDTLEALGVKDGDFIVYSRKDGGNN